MPVIQVVVEMRLANGSRRMEVNASIIMLIILIINLTTLIDMLGLVLKFSHLARLPKSLKTQGKVKGAHGQAILSPKEKCFQDKVTHSLAKMLKVLNKNRQPK